VGAAFPEMQKMASQKKKKLKARPGALKVSADRRMLKAAAERSSAAGKTAFCGHAS